MPRDKQPSMSPSQDLNPVPTGTKWEQLLLDGTFCCAIRQMSRGSGLSESGGKPAGARTHVKLLWPRDWRKGKVVGQPRGHRDGTPVVAQWISFFGRVHDFRIVNTTSSRRWEHFHRGRRRGEGWGRYPKNASLYPGSTVSYPNLNTEAVPSCKTPANQIGLYLLSNTTIWWIYIYIYILFIYYIENNYMFRRLVMAIFRLYMKHIVSSYTHSLHGAQSFLSS